MYLRPSDAQHGRSHRGRRRSRRYRPREEGSVKKPVNKGVRGIEWLTMRKVSRFRRAIWNNGTYTSSTQGFKKGGQGGELREGGGRDQCRDARIDESTSRGNLNTLPSHVDFHEFNLTVSFIMTLGTRRRRERKKKSPETGPEIRNMFVCPSWNP